MIEAVIFALVVDLLLALLADVIVRCFPERLEDYLRLSKRELSDLLSTAHEHDLATVTRINPESLGSIVLRLLDFECLTAYRDYHIAQGDFTEKLADKVCRAIADKRFLRVELVDSIDEFPGFMLFLGMETRQKVINFVEMKRGRR